MSLKQELQSITPEELWAATLATIDKNSQLEPGERDDETRRKFESYAGLIGLIAIADALVERGIIADVEPTDESIVESAQNLLALAADVLMELADARETRRAVEGS